MFERFTDRARRVVVLAQEEARMLNHNYIGTEHILLGLIHEGEGVAAKALESLGISLDAVREQVQDRNTGAAVSGQDQHAASGHIPFTPDSSFLLIRVFGPCSGHYGPHISTVQDSSFSFTRRSAYSVMFSGCSVPRSSNVTRGVSPQVRARCERAQLQRREESPPVIPCAHRRVKHRGARPVDHR